MSKLLCIYLNSHLCIYFRANWHKLWLFLYVTAYFPIDIPKYIFFFIFILQPTTNLSSLPLSKNRKIDTRHFFFLNSEMSDKLNLKALVINEHGVKRMGTHQKDSSVISLFWRSFKLACLTSWVCVSVCTVILHVDTVSQLLALLNP